MIVRNSRRGKTLNMTGKINIIKKPNYFKPTKSSLFKEKNNILSLEKNK